MNKLKQSLVPESGKSAASPKRPVVWLGFTVLVWFPLIILLHAWAITLFWAWFIMPQFGTAPLSLPIAAGLDLFFGFLTARQTPTPMLSEDAKEKYKEKYKELSWSERIGRMIVPSFGLALLRVCIVLVFGLVVHLFVRH